MKTFKIKTYEAVGDLTFKMNKNQVRKILGNDYKEFKKSRLSKTLTDNYKYAHIYYNENDNLDAIEFFNEDDLSLTLNGKNLTDFSYNDLKIFILTLDKNLIIEADNFTSKKLGIGAYAPNIVDDKNAISETIIVFKEGYYN